MPRLTMAAAAAFLLLPAAVATAGPQSAAREAQVGYTAMGGAAGVASFSVGGQGSTVGAATLVTLPGERSVTLSIADDSGRPVAASVVQVLDEQTGEYVHLGELCGTEPSTFRLQAQRAPVSVRPLLGTCDTAASVPVGGVVTARFTRG